MVIKAPKKLSSFFKPLFKYFRSFFLHPIGTTIKSLFNSLKQGLRIFGAVKECVGKPMWEINLVFPDILWLEITIIYKNNYLNQGFGFWGILLSIPLTISEFLSYIGKSQIYPFSLLFL